MIKKKNYKLIILLTTVFFFADNSFGTLPNNENLPDITFESHRSNKTTAQDFKTITDISKRKEAFFKFLYPIIVNENNKVLKQRAAIQRLSDKFSNGSLTKRQEKWTLTLAIHYGLKDIVSVSKDLYTKLLNSTDYIPPDLALAQAALESAFGTSRFATKANNYFGQWCFQKGCGLIPKHRSNKQTHEVRKFASIEHAIYAYIHNLNTSRVYRPLRNIRKNMRISKKIFTGIDLANGLILYSQEKEIYVHKIKNLIKQNKLERFK
jgi:Bax protein